MINEGHLAHYGHEASFLEPLQTLGVSTPDNHSDDSERTRLDLRFVRFRRRSFR